MRLTGLTSLRGALGSVVATIYVVGTAIVAPVPAQATEAETSYIIQVPEAQKDALLDKLDDLGVAPETVYDNALDGVAVALTPDELAGVTSVVGGETVSLDAPVELMDVQASAPWNLSMIDFAGRPADTQFVYPASAGAGTRVYVIDTGIAPNSQLGNRLAAGKDFVGDGVGTGDCNGHGTHVAGTIASTSYGVAKAATVVPVRVFSCTGSTSTAKILSAIDWAITNKPAGTVAVINMSLGASCGRMCAANDPFMVAVQKAVNAGFVVAVAAGNSARDACSYTPAAAPSALTVGAIDSADAEAKFSNYGPCVDMYAPGVDVVSLTANVEGSTTAMSGTSMASPHVAGAAALFVAANPTMSATDIVAAMQNGVATGLVAPYLGHTGSANAELNIASLLSGTVNPPAAPTNFSAKPAGLTSIALAWGQPVSSATITTYQINYRATGTSIWASAPTVTAPGTTVSGLIPGKSYDFRVRAVTTTPGAFTPVVSASTLSGIPSIVSGLKSSFTSATTIVLAWLASLAPGSTVTDYAVNYRPVGSTTWLAVADGVSPSTSASVMGLAPATAYEFRVAGISPLGQGSWSPTFTVKTGTGIPSAPSGVAVTTTGLTSTGLTWSAPSGNGSPVIDYRVQYRLATSPTWQTFSDGVSTNTTSTVTGLNLGSAYVFRIVAQTAYGLSAPSPLVTATLLNGKPRAVTAMTATPSASTLTLRWQPAVVNGAPVTDYVIDYRLSTTSTWTRFDDGIGTQPTATINGLTKGASYFVRVFAVSRFGAGSAAITASRTTN